MSLSIQEILSIVALIIATLSFFVNFAYTWYTRRQLQISTSPSVHVGLLATIHQILEAENEPFHGITGTDIEPDIINLSSSISVSEVNVTVDVEISQQGFLFPRHETKTFLKEYSSSLAPLEAYKSPKRSTLEYFLADKFPQFVQKYENHYSRVMGEKTTNYPSRSGRTTRNTMNVAYKFLKLNTVGVIVRVSFRPGLHNARIRKTERHYRFFPSFQSPDRFLISWEIKEKRRFQLN